MTLSTASISFLIEGHLDCSHVLVSGIDFNRIAIFIAIIYATLPVNCARPRRMGCGIRIRPRLREMTHSGSIHADYIARHSGEAIHDQPRPARSELSEYHPQKEPARRAVAVRPHVFQDDGFNQPSEKDTEPDIAENPGAAGHVAYGMQRPPQQVMARPQQERHHRGPHPRSRATPANRVRSASR